MRVRFLAPAALTISYVLFAAHACADPIEWPKAIGGNGHYYEYIATGLPWDQARDAASTMSINGVPGHLATITSQAENDWLVLTFPPNIPPWGGYNLGGYQPPEAVEPSGGWTWVTGEPWAYSNWYAGEPNDANGNEDCLSVIPGGQWNDGPFSNPVPFIVEYDVAIPPVTGVVFNGTFELGNQGFTTAHQYSPGNLWTAATYDISTDPRLSHPYAASYGDHTSGSGYMMVLNGVEGSQATAWSQTLEVMPNRIYRVGFFVSSWSPNTFALLDVVCNGNPLGVFMAPISAGQWQEHYLLWQSDLSSTLSLQIINRNPDGSDFALDDISIIDQGVVQEPVSCIEAPGGLLAWWPFDEQSGVIAADNIGMSAGSMVNGATWTSGLVGSAAQFDGSDDYVEVQDSDLWAFGSSDFTIELWANWDVSPGGTIQNPGSCLVANDEGGGEYNKWTFQASSSVLSFHINDQVLGPEWFPIVTFDPVLGTWYHLAVTRHGDLYTIYIGGYPRGSAINERDIYNPAAPLTIGQAEGGGFMHGRIDELTIYDRALGGDEIRSIALAGQYGKCKNANKPEIADVPEDQGGMLSVGWKRHAWDVVGSPAVVTSYDVQRYGSDWASIANVVAAYADSYSVTLPTTDVLVIGQPAPYSQYRLVARTESPDVFFTSSPDSGYSIDNLPPASPSLELFDSETNRSLVWQNPTPADFGETCLHRRGTPGFEASDPLVCSATQFWYQETDLNRYWYRACSFDIHGNASEWSNEVVGQYPTGVPGVPTALRLYPNQPNWS